MPPLGCEAPPRIGDLAFSDTPYQQIYDCFAAERGQAPSPQSPHRDRYTPNKQTPEKSGVCRFWRPRYHSPHLPGDLTDA
ncbi:hypothetical protein EMIT0215P_110077 [Pseudomonas serboccidentalis]